MLPNWTKQTLSPNGWFWIALFCFLPLHVSAVVLDKWFVLPPNPIGDGPEYEAIGYGLSQAHGWSTSYSDPQWRSVYEFAQSDVAGPDYHVQLARVGPVAADTNRPPLLPLCIATVYRFVPRGPIAFGTIRIGLAVCLSVGCALAVAWGVALVNERNKGSALLTNAVGAGIIAIVFSERNLRNYTTDFLTEPIALVLTQAFIMVAWYGSKRGAWGWAISTGILFAGMVFCRSLYVLWLPLMIPWLWIGYRLTSQNSSASSTGPPRMAPHRWILVCTATFCLMGSLWWCRNCWVLDSFHPLGTKGATTLMGGYCDEAFIAGGEWQFAPEKALRIKLDSTIDIRSASASDLRELELEMGRQAHAQVLKWTMDNILSLPQLVLKRIVTEWNPYSGKAMVLKLLALIGVLTLLRTNAVALFWITGPLVINTVVVAATYSVGGRFLVPTYGSIYILAAFGTANILEFCSKGGESRKPRSGLF